MYVRAGCGRQFKYLVDGDVLALADAEKAFLELCTFRNGCGGEEAVASGLCLSLQATASRAGVPACRAFGAMSHGPASEATA